MKDSAVEAYSYDAQEFDLRNGLFRNLSATFTIMTTWNRGYK